MRRGNKVPAADGFAPECHVSLLGPWSPGTGGRVFWKPAASRQRGESQISIRCHPVITAAAGVWPAANAAEIQPR